MLFSNTHYSAVLGQTFSDVASPGPTALTTTLPPASSSSSSGDCSANGGCLACIGAGCAWGIGTCFTSCDEIPDSPECYSTTSADQFGATADSLCAQQQAAASDAATCGIQATCEACTSTSLASATGSFGGDATTKTTCSWYEDRQKCSHVECDSGGCASPYCPGTPEGQCYFAASNCRECLAAKTDSGAACSWAVGSCELTCAQDASCFSEALFAGSSMEEICVMADSQQVGAGAGSTDGSSGARCSSLSDFLPADITCQACLNANCGWTGVACLESCSVLADDKCFDTGTPTTMMPGSTTTTPTTAAPGATPTTTAPGAQSVTSICLAAEDALADEATCSAITDCDICTSQTLKDGFNTCAWYTTLGTVSGGYCGTGGCDSQGNCPTIACDSTSGTTDATRGGCSDLITCLSCLSDISSACVWVGETCQEFCSADLESTCYNVNSYMDLTNSAICDLAAEEAANGSSGASGIAIKTAAMIAVLFGGMVLL